MELTGRVKKLLETQTFNSGFTKRELILQTQEQYPQTISIEFLQDNVNLLNDLREGDEVKVAINLRGREWVNPEGVTKYFNSIVGWRIEKVVVETVGSQPSPSAPTAPTFNDDYSDLTSEEEDDDLPF